MCIRDRSFMSDIKQHKVHKKNRHCQAKEITFGDCKISSFKVRIIFKISLIQRHPVIKMEKYKRIRIRFEKGFEFFTVIFVSKSFAVIFRVLPSVFFIFYKF